MKDSELLRYSRHILLPQIDLAGQEALLSSHVAIVGLGGLGSPVALYLASSGVGRLTLVDDDVVELGNLQRQIIHSEKSLGDLKVLSAKKRLSSINPGTEVQIVDHRLDELGLIALANDASVIVDCTDNFDTRHLVNIACVKTRTPLVSAAAIRFEGQLMVWDPTVPSSPCYACLYPSDQPIEMSCSTTGVAAPLVGVMGGLQAMETLKLIAGISSDHTGRLTTYDGVFNAWNSFTFKRKPDCSACGNEAN